MGRKGESTAPPPDDSSTSPGLPILQKTPGFRGCLRNLVINDRTYRFGKEPIGDALQGFDIGSSFQKYIITFSPLSPFTNKGGQDANSFKEFEEKEVVQRANYSFSTLTRRPFLLLQRIVMIKGSVISSDVNMEVNVWFRKRKPPLASALWDSQASSVKHLWICR